MEGSEKLCADAGIPQLALEKPPSAQKVELFLKRKKNGKRN